MRIPGLTISLAVASLCLVMQAAAQRSEYHVDRAAKNLVTFISDAPIEDFEGSTSKIDGYLAYDGESFTSNSDLYFEVDLRTLDTGIGLRNRHMREDYLHTKKYPYAKFRGKIIAATPSGDKTTVKVSGSMDIHGVKRSMDISGTIRPSGDRLRITTTFDVSLPHHDIEVPQFMFMKIDENMELVLDFTLKNVK
ncbi:MAG: YceI family protein [Bacteroidota bacterium]|jgi:polyisoprenoid-binding protein YceI|nr:YceI family protein [Bacteroidota bacterium]